MAMTEHPHQHESSNDRLRTVSRYVFFGFAAIAAFFLITEHRAHLYGWLPFLLLAACPLLHLFHGHGHDHGADQDESKEGGESTRGGGHAH